MTGRVNVEGLKKEECSGETFKMKSSLPIIKSDDNIIHKYTGIFNGFSVIVKDVGEMKELCLMGLFGKANLSRSYPTYNESEVEIVRKRTMEERKKWEKKSSNRPVKVLVVPDNEEDDDYFVDLQPEFQLDRSCIKETLHLALEEAFFLFQYVECLAIYYDHKILSEKEVWKSFVECDKHFVENYAVYHYFRSKNWVVKPGLKFGGDFLLYKEGPNAYHASYLVIIDVVDKNFRRREELCRRSMEITNILGLNRLCETVGKELLLCQVVWPENLVIAKQEDLADLAISETLMRRWIPSQNREKLEI